MQQSLTNRITSDPAILGGRPIIRGMRIRVSDIFPDLEDEDISAALEYAKQLADHRLIAAE
jgi:uncharacterized protein (DUF433 family)